MIKKECEVRLYLASKTIPAVQPRGLFLNGVNDTLLYRLPLLTSTV